MAQRRIGMDYGATKGELSEGLASGIAGGIGNVLQARQMNKDRQLQMRRAGLIEDEGGQLVESPEAKRQRTLNEAEKKGGLLSRGIIIKENEDGFDVERDSSYKDPYARRAELEAAKLAREEDPRYRLRKEGGEVRGKLGNIANAMQQLSKYGERIESGDEQSYFTPKTPLIGGILASNPIDIYRQGFVEELGRLQTGAAITKSEEEAFLGMLPKPADFKNPEVVQQKINNLRNSLESKLMAYGYQPQDLEVLGFDPADLGYGESSRGLLAGEKGSAPGAAAEELRPGSEEDLEKMSPEQLERYLGRRK